MIVKLINQGSFFFGTFFLHTIRGQVSHLRGFKKTYKTFMKKFKKSRATSVLWQGPYSTIAMDVQNMLWCLYFYRSM